MGDTDRGIVKRGAMLGLAFTQRVFGHFAARDVFGKNNDPADAARLIPPGANLPPKPVDGPVGTLEPVFLNTDHLAG